VNVTDDSFIPEIQSRFRCGIVGIAERGNFDVAIPTRSFKDYARQLGGPVSVSPLSNTPPFAPTPSTLDDHTSYMAQAAALISQFSDGLICVRVGRRYTEAVPGGASGAEGASVIRTQNANLLAENDYVRIVEAGKASTVNARVESIDLNTNEVTLVSSGEEAQTLEDDYTSAKVDTCPVRNAANEAETFLDCYEYEDDPVEASPSVPLQIVGDRNGYACTVVNAPTSYTDFANILPIGSLIKITQSGRHDTQEVKVRTLVPASAGTPGQIYFETSTDAESGYQPLPLQDSYTAGQIYKVEVLSGVYSRRRCMQILANSPGTWANSVSVDDVVRVSASSKGLNVRIAPGSSANTKRILVYLDGSLQETLDNVVFDDSTDPNYVTTRVNGNSTLIDDVMVLRDEAPANTLAGWNSGPNNLNDAKFSKGFNGEAATIQDFIGSLNPNTDQLTGVKVFEDKNAVQVNVIAAPGRSDIYMAQEMARIARKVNAVAVLDVPRGLNLREAVDWHNGDGLYSGNGRIDNPYVALYWNWFRMADAFTGQSVWTPPSLGALRALAYTFQNAKPWFAAAGDARGQLPEATAVEFDRVQDENLDAAYGNGNSINPILLYRGRIQVYGERTLQRAESKLTALHNVILVNYVVNGLSIIGRQFVFEPNDNTLLDQVKEAYSGFLEGIRNERGIEGYDLTIDSTNNNADTRNRREVVVDLSIIPTDAAERILVNATVRESGAVLNQAS